MVLIRKTKVWASSGRDVLGRREGKYIKYEKYMKYIKCGEEKEGERRNSEKR